MGLFNRRESFLRRFVGDTVYWHVAIGVALISVGVALFGDEGRELLKYDRLAIADGEYWRLVTGHFAHLGNTHLALNLAGLVLVWLLVGRYFTNVQWLVVVLLTLAVTSAGFWFVDQYLLWYVGLSGMLHGLLLAGAIQGFRTLPSESAIICAIVAGKLAWEQLAGPVPGSESVSGGAVVVNAHLFGAIGGVVAGGLLWRSAGDKRSI